MHPRETVLPNGVIMPAYGMGTWNMGDSFLSEKEEVSALIHGIELGMTLIDTAEMYANGQAERVTAKAIAGRRSRVFLVSKVLPGNAGRQAAITACEGSLRRLKTDYLDLYLLHWRGSFRLEETFGAFEELHKAGKIRAYGVSNFDLVDMEEAEKIAPGQNSVNQVLYNIGSRGIEWDLLPWQKQRNIALMAYSPLHQTRLLRNAQLVQMATELSITPAQLALSWLFHQGVVPIPKSSSIANLDQNRKAWDIVLDARTLERLDMVFPPPTRKRPLDLL